MNPRSFLRRVAMAAFLAAGIASVGAGQPYNPNPDLFERVLVPVSVSLVPGAYGTVWSTQLLCRNNGTVPVGMFPIVISHWGSAVGITDRVPIWIASPERPGGFLYMTRPGSEYVQFDLRLFNRDDLDLGSSWGTKIPVVRDKQFAEVVELINVPTRTDFRSALHIYGLPEGGEPGETVHVRIYSYREQLLASTELPFTDGSPRHAAILSLADTFPQIRQADRVRVHLESRSRKVKIWAIVGIVSNTTQHVSIVTPD